MNHTTAKDFNPAGAFAETAAFSSTFEAGNINLSAWLCEREMMRTEFGFCLRSEQLFCKLLKRSLKVCKGNVLINNETFNLMEGRRMCCIYLIRTEYTTRCDHTDREFALFHLTCLNR